MLLDMRGLLTSGDRCDRPCLCGPGALRAQCGPKVRSPVADASGAPVLRDQGPERPAGHGKADANLDQLTSCSQNQIRQDCYLAWGEPRFADGGPAGRGRPPQAATRRAGLEVVEKLLTNITSGSV